MNQRCKKYGETLREISYKENERKTLESANQSSEDMFNEVSLVIPSPDDIFRATMKMIQEMTDQGIIDCLKFYR
jgi:thermostable 8-oxoguanine DNA glycosylase